MIGGLLAGAGVVLLIVTAVRRSRGRRAPLTPDPLTRIRNLVQSLWTTSEATNDARPATPARSANRAASASAFLMYIVTFGVYSFYWVYKTQEEMKRRTGEGLGGVLGLVVSLLARPRHGVRDSVGDREDVQEGPPGAAVHGLDRAMALSRRDPARPGDRLVRESTASPQPLLGAESSRAWSHRLINGARQRWSDATTIMRRNLRAETRARAKPARRQALAADQRRRRVPEPRGASSPR